MLRRRRLAGVTRLLRRHIDEALRVGGVGDLVGAASRPSTAPAGLEALPRPAEVEAQALQDVTAGGSGREESQDDVLGPDRLVL